jgi:hypothetical protein
MINFLIILNVLLLIINAFLISVNGRNLRAIRRLHNSYVEAMKEVNIMLEDKEKVARV